ncbi:MAG: IclR family transcriptional regulator [bacterium]|nr:IclR family transcriptional regulator [bacterium]
MTMNNSIIKAFDVLTFIVDNPQKMSLSEISKKLGMNKTTLFRFLTTLESIGIVSKKDDYYVPGMKLFELGCKVPLTQLLVDKIHPIISRLTAEVNEAVNVGMFSNDQVLYLDKSESRRSFQIRTSVGGYTALHATGLGKSILSILPENTRELLLNHLILDKRTPKTITAPGILKEQIEGVLRNGYSTDYEELEEGLFCVAVPLLIEELNFYGAISCSGPNVRFTPDYMLELASKLKHTVEDIKIAFK